MDAVTPSITRGQLVMPRISAPSQQKALRNHPAWENDKDAKRALGPVIAKWLASSVLEYVAWDDRMPILLQPCGAVPKGAAPLYRLITDARFANKFYSDWGVTYTTAAQLSSTLDRRHLHFSIDISDAYHLSLWAGRAQARAPPLTRRRHFQSYAAPPRLSYARIQVHATGHSAPPLAREYRCALPDTPPTLSLENTGARYRTLRLSHAAAPVVFRRAGVLYSLRAYHTPPRRHRAWR